MQPCLILQELRYFWISWGSHKIEVGRGSHYGDGKFLKWNLPENKRFDITSLAVATDNTSHGQFEFAELMGMFVDCIIYPTATVI